MQIDQRGGVVILDVRGQVGKKDIGAGRVDTTYEALRADYQAAHVPGRIYRRRSPAVRMMRPACCLAGAMAHSAAPAQPPTVTRSSCPRTAGAVFVDWTRDIVNLDDDTAPVQLAPMADFAASMEQKGVGTDKTV